jgi:signal peptidase I
LGHQRIDPAPSHSAKKARPSRRRRRRRLAINLALVIVVATGTALVLRASVVQPFTVPSAAMTPTLQVGDRILVVKSSRLAGPIHLGDIVVFRHPKLFPCKAPRDQSRDLVQRVIGLPGDTIWSAGNKIYIDGQLLHERGWYDPRYGQVGSTSMHRTKIPPDKYFVMGDNRSDSCDSRVFGTIARSSIIGKVFAIVARGGHVHLHYF